ncbi:hypothetical protein ASF23_17275 [Curtobacterium sp. Leaf261]|nr:hypothetical protein ASF23_17275 [Curtobacterium sp. Leaf261]
MQSTDVGDESEADAVRRRLPPQERYEQLGRLRAMPDEWRKRGMRDPAAISALVQERLDRSDALEAEVRYADFLSDPEFGWS